MCDNSPMSKRTDIDVAAMKARLEEMKAELELPDADPEAEAASIEDCIEVIRWYQDQIGVKLMRALRRDELDAEFPSDSDGSAKVALIGIDRSIGAWSRFREHFSEKTDDILNILLQLDHLRQKTEQEFPKARSFVRPGFDTDE